MSCPNVAHTFLEKTTIKVFEGYCTRSDSIYVYEYIHIYIYTCIDNICFPLKEKLTGDG